MMKIYLCEDSKPQLDALENLIQKYLFINHLNGKVICKATRPEQLLSHLAQASSYLGLYYLDVDLKQQENGFDLAAKIRAIDPRAHIVFISIHKEMSLEPYQLRIEAMDFIWKSDAEMSSRMLQCLDRAFENYHRFVGPFLKKELILMNRGECQYVETSRIIYLEALGKSHKFNIIMENELIQHRGSLNEIMLQLDANSFYRCHHSYIINQEYVQTVNPKEHMVILKTGENIPYSFRKQQGLFDWLKKNHVL